MRSIGYIISILVVTVFLFKDSYSLDTAFLQKVRVEEQTAYEEICSGNYREGLKRLVYLFREMPADDVQCADIMISPVQLFLFSMGQYMGGKLGIIEFERGIGESRIEDFGQYPTDELISGLVLLNEKDMMKYTGYVKLYKLTGSSHWGVQFISSAICMLGMPREYFKEDPVQFSINILEKAKSYKDLNIVRQMSLMPVLEYVEKEYVEDIEKRRYFGEHVKEMLGVYGGWVVQRLGAEMPSLGCILDKIAEIERERFMIEMSFQRLSKEVMEEKDSICQYGELVLLSKLGGSMQWEAVCASLEEIIHKTNLNDAINIRAKLILSEYLQRVHELKRMRELSKEILGWGVLPGVIDTNLYEEQVRVLKGLGKYYLKYGWYAEAEEVYRGLVEKYEGSRVSKDAVSWLRQIERSPLDASIEVIAEGIESIRRSGAEERVKAYYREIAERTPNAQLRARLEFQEGHAGEKLKYSRRMNEFEEAIFSNTDPALQPFRDALKNSRNRSGQ